MPPGYAPLSLFVACGSDADECAVTMEEGGVDLTLVGEKVFFKAVMAAKSVCRRVDFDACPL